MKNGHLLFLGTLYCCINMAACKLDPPIMPGDKGYVATPENTVPGSKGSTGATDSSGTVITTDTSKKVPPAFSGTWFCNNTYAENYNQAGVLQNKGPSDSFYYTITFDSVKNTAAFKLTPNQFPGPAYYEYTMIRDDAGNNYILLNPDAFFRSANNKIQIVDQTPLSMTWIITDPKLHNVNGVNVYTTNRLDLIKIVK